jgi:YidC/Oxa1 family membrane protein insertase
MKAVSTRCPRNLAAIHHHENSHRITLMDNPRVLLAIALSFLVLLIWQAWMEDYGPQPKPAEQATVIESPVVDDSGEDLPVAPDDQPPASSEEDIPPQLPAGQRVEVATDMFRQ